MKKLVLLLGLFAVALTMVGSANAAQSVVPLIASGGATLFSDNSAEFLINVDGSVSAGGTPTVTVGDILVGIVGINTIETVGSTTIGSGTVYNEVTGIFALKIATNSDVDLGPPGPDDSFGTQNIDLHQYTSVPLAAGDAVYFNWATGQINTDGVGPAEFTFTPVGGTANNGLLFGLVFEDAAQNYDRDSTVQTGFTSATGGTNVLQLSLIGANGDFFSAIAPFDVAGFGTVPKSTAIDNTNIAFDGTITAQNWAPLTFNDNITAGNGGFSSPSPTSAFGIFDNLDFTVTAVPEPAAMLLFGSGLIGLAALTRRFKK